MNDARVTFSNSQYVLCVYAYIARAEPEHLKYASPVAAAAPPVRRNPACMRFAARARDYKQRFENNDIHMHFTHKMNLFTYIVYTNCATKISYFRIEKSLKLLYDLTRELARENEPILIGAIEIYIRMGIIYG